MSEKSTGEAVNQVLAVGALGFGVLAVLAPGGLRRMYGMDAESSELTYFGRMWGSRTAAIGGLALAARDEEDRRRLAVMAVAMNGADALFAAATPGLPARTRVMATLTSAGFAAAAGYALTED